MKIAIIGSSGMLGKIVFNYFRMYYTDIRLIIPIKFNIDKKNEFISSLKNADYVINCSGAIPQKMPKDISTITQINYFKIIIINTFFVQHIFNFKFIFKK